MSITINGNGTVTGISVGGLPDGIVDTDMIANNAVTNAKATGIAGGKILQVIDTGILTTTVTATTATGTLELTNATITPASTSNKVLIMATVTMFSTYGSSNTFGGVYIFRGNNNSTTIHQASHGGKDSYEEATITPYVLDSPNTTSAQKYTIGLNRWSSGTNNVETSRYSLMLMEIAA